MRERPILFSAPMVRAILAGTKTQTRRPMRVQPSDETTVTVEHFNQTVIDRYGDEQPGPEIFGAWWHDGESGVVCPYGQPGDRLWVRETSRCIGQGTDFVRAKVRLDVDYKAGGGTSFTFELDEAPRWFPGRTRNVDDSPRWQPAIHMPRWSSRILLAIVAVRVERLHDISDADCIAEGAPGGHDAIKGYAYNATPREHYKHIWESLGGPGSWQANPLVWVIEFRRAAA